MISIELIKEELKSTKHLFIFIRHGEKSQSQSVDNLTLLSPDGITDSIELGKKIEALNIPVKIFSSPEFRCIQTAKLINKSFPNTDILLTTVLGEPGIQIKNVLEYNKIYKSKKCREIYTEWKNGKHYDVLYNPSELKKRILNFINANNDFEGISICVTQSGTVAHLGHVLGKKDFDVEKGEWVKYLDGFFINSKRVL